MYVRAKTLVAMGAVLFAVGLTGRLHAAESRRATPAHRPYIVEIGDPQRIDQGRLEREMRTNGDLRQYVEYYGYPEAAETQEVIPDAPWDTYEVRLFYLHRDQEVTFGRVFVAPTVTDFGVMKYEGPIQPADRKRLASAPTSMAKAEGDVYERVGKAAERAAAAAERAEVASLQAAQAADRAVAAVDRMERGFQQRLVK